MTSWMQSLAYLPLTLVVRCVPVPMHRHMVSLLAEAKVHPSDCPARLLQGMLAIFANLGSEGWQGLSLKSLNGYMRL